MAEPARIPDLQPEGNPSRQPGRWVVFAAIAVSAAIAGIAVLLVDPFARSGSGLSERFTHSTEDYSAADPALIRYREAQGFAVELSEPRAVAVGPQQQIYVAGDRTVAVYGPGGEPVAKWPLEAAPTCIAAAGAEHAHPGRVYVGAGRQVLVFQPDGAAVGTWDAGLDERSLLTSIAVADENVFVADAGNRVVLRFGTDGALVGRIGEIDEARGVRGFVVPSPCFDVAVAADGLLRVTNPGARRIETYTFDGDLLGGWGAASAAIEGFFGCCNPANFALLADGRFVTCEKGIPRIKVYDRRGVFESVVADPRTLGQTPNMAEEIREEHQAKVFDVAVADGGRVVVLDPSRRALRFFDPIAGAETAPPAGETAAGS